MYIHIIIYIYIWKFLLVNAYAHIYLLITNCSQVHFTIIYNIFTFVKLHSYLLVINAIYAILFMQFIIFVRIKQQL